MLLITIKPGELYNEEENVFIQSTKEQILQLEHSLVSVSKWESKWCKPFLTNLDKTREESIDYVRCMTITPNVDPNIYGLLSQENINEVGRYIEQPMTATTFASSSGKRPNKEIITSEIIYYWMIAHSIPFECQKWHLNRLLTLISVCNIKNQPQKKMTRQELLAFNKGLNESRKQALNTTG